MLRFIRSVDSVFARIPEAAALVFVRVVAGHVFWAAGETRRADGTWFGLKDGQVDLFRDEFHTPFPEIMAPVTMGLEHLLPILLVLGLFGRFAALGMAVMTLVIQLFIYPDAWWTEHSLWLALLLTIMVRGPGTWSLDRWVMGKAA
jgi:putative oxidoreductase